MHDDLKQSQRDAAHDVARKSDSVEALQDNLSRALLLIHALTETLVRKGLVTRDEIAAVAAQLDMLDGQADGKLDLGSGAGAEKTPESPLSTQEFLRNLEKS